MTSYVLGDLDIAKSAQDGSDSFDISSNTSVVKSEEAKQEDNTSCSFLSSAIQENKQPASGNKFLANEAYKSFMT